MHTADGISIRFPRVTRIRDDKDWETATSFPELRALLKNSAESVDYSLLLGAGPSKRPPEDDEAPKKKPRKPNSSGGGEGDSSSPKRRIKIEKNDEESVDYSDVKVKTEITDAVEPLSSKRTIKREKKTSPKKERSPGKLITEFINRNQTIKKEKSSDSDSSNDTKEAKRAAFYSFLGSDVSVTHRAYNAFT